MAPTSLDILRVMHKVNPNLRTTVPETPPILYHYGSEGNLLRTIEGKYISATNIHFMNDVKEFKEGINLLRTEIERRLGNADEGNERYLLERVLHFIGQD